MASATAPSPMSTAGLRVFSVVLVALEFESEHQPRWLVEQQHHGGRGDQRRVQRGGQR